MASPRKVRSVWPLERRTEEEVHSEAILGRRKMTLRHKIAEYEEIQVPRANVVRNIDVTAEDNPRIRRSLRRDIAKQKAEEAKKSTENVPENEVVRRGRRISFKTENEENQPLKVVAKRAIGVSTVDKTATKIRRPLQDVVEEKIEEAKKNTGNELEKVVRRGRQIGVKTENEENQPLKVVAKRTIVGFAVEDTVTKIRRPLQDVAKAAQNMQPVALTKITKAVKRPPSMTLYKQLRELGERGGLISNDEIFDCEICLGAIGVGDGVRFRECLHQYCLTCAKNSVLFSDFAEIPCPFGDGVVTKCDYFILDSEIRSMLSADEYETFTKRSMRIAEGNITGSVHCKLPDCDGWCIVEDNVNEFKCPKCNSVNCIPCQAIHPGINCKQYQDNATLDESTKKYLEKLIKGGKAMKCTKCQIVIVKRAGCDGVRCVMCRTQLCWATKQARWGPKGHGDYSGGCGCNPSMGRKCHPKCNFCH